MRKHFLAIVAIVLVLAATACTQYPDDWKDYFPNMPESNTIKTIEDLYLFLASDGDGEAEVNLTTDLSWFPITVRGNKTITGKLNVTKSASSDITPQSAVTRSSSAKVLFEIEDDANVTISNFTTTISDNVKAEITSVIKVNNGLLTINEDFSVSTGAVAIEIGETAKSANNISGDLSSLTVTVNESNTNADKIANEVADKTGATVDVGDESYNEKYAILNTSTYKGYDDIVSALNEAATGNTIKLLKNTETDSQLVIENKSLTLELNDQAIVLNYSQSNGAAIQICNNANISINGNGTVHAKGNGTSVMIVYGATATINGGTFISDSGNGLNVGKSGDIGNIDSWIGGTLTINDGTVHAREYGIGVYSDAALTINGGSFTAEDNAVIGTNGTRIIGENGDTVADNDKYPAHTIIINGGTFNANIVTDGYIACGIYMANKGKVSITGGTFNINGGTGIVIRGGELDASNMTINLIHNDEVRPGGVGDKKVKLPVDTPIVFDDYSSPYPAADTMKITNSAGYEVYYLKENPITD